ncbi:MAG: SIR2 family protein [Chloroflexi bacterium]|nr:SIR2 family protein [Chloroflexota bacterium]
MHPFKRDEILILLGAGASSDAGIPHSAKMIQEVESLIKEARDWACFKDLYNYVRSSIYHSEGIRGRFGNDVNYNIERLVNTLNEIAKKREHTLYPFVGAWDPTLAEVAGRDFELVVRLRNEILRRLREKWLPRKGYSASAGYLKNIIKLQQEFAHPLRVFTLNYDLCVERTCAEAVIERGFRKDTGTWDWRQFIDNVEEPNIYLYKLHGSTDWTYDKDTDDLIYFDDPDGIEDDDAAMIFGTSYKLEYRDPFLFLAYQFRQWTLETRIIVSIGYGFGDEHINKIIQQALNRDKQRLLLSISPFEDKRTEADQRADIARTIPYRNPEQIICGSFCAREFMSQHLCLGYLAQLLPAPVEPFLVVSTN